MKTYKVTITGNQQHISINEWEGQNVADVENILNSYWDKDYPKPQMDGNNWELNGDQNICIVQEVN